jgi:flagellar protein FliO/FliZ
MMRFILLSTLLVSSTSWATESATISPSGSMLKMIVGLIVVLAVLAFLTWILKRLMPGVGGQNSVIHIVGGVSLGSRERVVVLEVAGRWLVVGVAPGQINAIANLEIGNSLALDSIAENDDSSGVNNQNVTPVFAHWLKKSASKFRQK